MSRENEIRLIAYRIWEEEGCCQGQDLDHWIRAEIIWEEQQKPKKASASTGTAVATGKPASAASKATPEKKPAARRPVSRKKAAEPPENPEPKAGGGEGTP